MDSFFDKTCFITLFLKTNPYLCSVKKKNDMSCVCVTQNLIFRRLCQSQEKFYY